MKRSAQTANERVEANRESKRRSRARHLSDPLRRNINIFSNGSVQIRWTKACSYCRTLLLSTETNGWCCNNGKLNIVNHISTYTSIAALTERRYHAYLPTRMNFERLCLAVDGVPNLGVLITSSASPPRELPTATLRPSTGLQTSS